MIETISAGQAAKRSAWVKLLDAVQPWVRKAGFDDGHQSRLIAAGVVLLVPGGLVGWLVWRLVRKSKA